MATFKTICPECGHLIELENSWIDMELSCPKCQKKFVAEKASKSRIAEVEGGGKTSNKESLTKRIFSIRNILAFIGILVVVMMIAGRVLEVLDEVQVGRNLKSELNLNILDDAEAKYKRSSKYLGQGDTENAIALLKEAADEGHAEAQVYMAACYARGLYVKQDIPKGFRLAKKAAEKNVPEAYSLLVTYYSGILGNEYADIEKAFEYSRMAANAGIPEAKAQLGSFYLLGIGCQKDVNRAVDLFKEAAEKGAALGQAYLGYCYLAGEGVTKDISRGLWYLNKAAEQENPDAYAMLAYYYMGTYGKEYINYAKAFEFSQKFADTGLPGGKLCLGMCYANGLGCQADRNKAIELYKEAARLGEPNAQQTLKDMGIAW